MRRSLVAVALVLTACNGEGQKVAPTPPTSSPAETTTSVLPDSTTTIRPTTTTTAAPTTTTTLPPLQSLRYQEVASLDFPVQVVALPDAEFSYIATKDGRVWAYDGTDVLDEPVLDINDRVRNSGEQGLLSITLDPNDGSRFYAHYSANDGDTVVSEFAFDAPSRVDPASEEVLLRLDQPARNHNGGMLQVYDGHLFVGLGDGGGANDRYGNGQNTGTLLGGLVQISLTGDPEPTLFQFGLRNPWRFWIDGDLVYISDVGQNAFEEVNVSPMTQGINYGWPITEGLHCFSPSSDCDTSGITLPVTEVSHGDEGTCSMTGGIVYRGSSIPEIDGHFFYSDYCGGYLRSIVYQEGEEVEEADWTGQVGVPGRVTGFGVDSQGEMYVTTTETVLVVVPVRE